ncbi:MAG: hypothetical protein E7585_00740 [Ruminococcaceae bacterium]|nr:hypothetical protein [Oscillospiraceae bacterium]
MRKHLLPENGRFYKANLHVHTTVSDGTATPEETKAGYMAHGYDIVAFTDHEVFVPQNALTDERFLAINAVELAINDGWPGGFKYNKSTHLNLYAMDPEKTDCAVCAGKFVWLEQSKPYISEFAASNKYRKHYSVAAYNDLIRKARADGFLTCYNHPVWSMHNYTDYSGMQGLWGVEVYNTGSARGGMEDTVQPFEDLLNQGQHLVPVAADDAHSLGASAYGGWTMIKAEALDYVTVMKALERGDCYSSNGPEIKELYIEDGVVHLTCSDAVFVRLVTSIRYKHVKHGTAEAPVNEIAFDINPFIEGERDCRAERTAPWFRLEVRDAAGNRAWTRGYFLDELQ